MPKQTETVHRIQCQNKRKREQQQLSLTRDHQVQIGYKKNKTQTRTPSVQDQTLIIMSVHSVEVIILFLVYVRPSSAVYDVLNK